METIEYKGFEIKIENDHDSMFDPRGDDNLGNMICFHRSYNLGDKHEYTDPEELMEYLKGENIVSLPLYLYDHSGITMNTRGFSCQWDSGQVGMIYTTLEQVNEYRGLNWKRFTAKRVKEIQDWLESEVKTYDDFITGNVYWYDVEDVDSCGGYFGYDHEESGLIQDAKANIDGYIRHKRESHFTKLKIWIKNRVPFQYREKLIFS